MAGEAGRPTVMTEEALQILEDAFCNDATDEQACFLAKICPSSLYNYQVEHPVFLERKTQLKEMIKFRAKKNMKEAIEGGSLEESKWYLERKAKNEGFSQRTELTGKDGKDFPSPIYGGKSTKNEEV